MAQILKELDTYVEQISRQYKTYSSVVSGSFFKASNTSITQRDILEFAGAVNNARMTSLNAIEGALSAASNLAQKRAYDIAKLSGASIDDALVESITGISDLTVSHIMSSIDAQMKRDKRCSELDLKRLMISSNAIIKNNAGQTKESALIGAKATTKLVYIDRSGKRWKSERFIRYVSRMNVIRIITDSVFVIASANNMSKMYLSNDESIDLEKYNDERDAYFHPNTKAIPVSIK